MHCPDCAEEMNEIDVYSITRDIIQVEVMCPSCGTKFLGTLLRTVPSKDAKKPE